MNPEKTLSDVVVEALLGENNVEVELHNIKVGSMPQTMWLMRQADSASYVARGVADSPKSANKQAHRKAKALGSKIGKSIDFRKQKKKV